MKVLNENIKSEFDFTEYLASLAHDMKNSLGMLLNATDEIINTCSGNYCPSHNLLIKLQYESKRVNNNLVQLLTLYKMDKSQLSINIDYYPVYEFIEDIVMFNKPLFDSKGISVEINCPDDILWFFDRDLLTGVVNNVINNVFKYTKDKLKIIANKNNSGFLFIHIDDNGVGYPDFMLKTSHDTPGKTNFTNGATGLGIYFANSVVRLHKNNEKIGYIEINNISSLGGGRFSIYLP